MSKIEIKASQLREEAVKRISSTTSLLKQWFSKSTKHLEESVEYFKRAGNLFKMAEKWPQAANSFADAATLSFKLVNPVEAAYNLIEEANCYSKYDIPKAVEVYLKAILIFQEKGKCLTAAKYYQVIAELLEDEYEIDEALIYYEKAFLVYRQECSFCCANKCYEKIADYAALSGNYVKAIRIFEEIACFDLASSVYKYIAKHYFFKAVVCILCTGTDITPKLRNYLNIYPAFEDTKEFQLLVNLRDCIRDGDVEGFDNEVRKFDSAADLGQWYITLLLRTQNQIKGWFASNLNFYRE